MYAIASRSGPKVISYFHALENTELLDIFNTYEHLKFHTQLSMKFFYKLRTRIDIGDGIMSVTLKAK